MGALAHRRVPGAGDRPSGASRQAKLAHDAAPSACRPGEKRESWSPTHSVGLLAGRRAAGRSAGMFKVAGTS